MTDLGYIGEIASIALLDVHLVARAYLLTDQSRTGASSSKLEDFQLTAALLSECRNASTCDRVAKLPFDDERGSSSTVISLLDVSCGSSGLFDVSRTLPEGHSRREDEHECECRCDSEKLSHG